jgi:hypothetical protein
MLNPFGTSIQQKNEETLLNIVTPSYMGLRAGAKTPTNMSRIVAVIQKPEKTLSDFYERLCEAIQIYTPFDPEVPENKQQVNMAFVTQSYADIHRKLQKLEGFTGMNATQLLEVANKVFINRENEEKWEADKRTKTKVSFFAAALGKPDPTQKPAPPHGRGDQMGEPHSGETNVPIARRLATGKMNVLIARGQHWSLTELLRERRQDGSLKWRPKTSLA